MNLWLGSLMEKMTVKAFLENLKEWESGGFISSDVWSDMESYVDSDAVASALSAVTMHYNDEEKKDLADYRFFSCVARYVVDSRVLHFTIDVLGLPAKKYQDKERRVPDQNHLMKFQVC